MFVEYINLRLNMKSLPKSHVTNVDTSKSRILNEAVLIRMSFPFYNGGKSITNLLTSTPCSRQKSASTPCICQENTNIKIYLERAYRIYGVRHICALYSVANDLMQAVYHGYGVRINLFLLFYESAAIRKRVTLRILQNYRAPFVTVTLYIEFPIKYSFRPERSIY